MTALIVLEAGQADHVRGPSAIEPIAALEPIALKDGRFLLGVAVLDDPAHAMHRAFLAALPRVEPGEIAELVPAAEAEAGEGDA